MSRSLRILLVFSVSAFIDSRALAQSLPGSQIPLEENACAMCHGASELWQGEQRRLYISTEDMAADVHWSKGVVCHDCHGGDPTGAQFRNTHRGEEGFPCDRRRSRGIL